jgi:ferrochelatase
MRGVLLVNMGGPESPEELKKFLSRMFRDPAILPFSKPVRHLLAFIISRSRYRNSWKKYELIGGTPLVKSTIKTAKALQSVLGESFEVKYAFSYQSPDITNALKDFKKEGISKIHVIPLYPQSSLTTTSSVKADIKRVTDKDPFFDLTVQEEFYTHPDFVAFWAFQIQKHLKEHGIVNPTLVFSAHSIPENLVSKGDTYPTGIINSAALIAENLGYHYEAAFQSGMKRGKWIGPDVREHLKTMKEEGIDDLVLIPISFVHENLETKYDLDHELLPYAKEELGFKHVSRVQLPEADLLFVSLLVDLVLKS